MTEHTELIVVIGLLGSLTTLVIGFMGGFSWLRNTFFTLPKPSEPAPPEPTNIVKMTTQQFADIQRVALKQARADWEHAEGPKRQALHTKIDELNRRLADPEEALAQQHAKILDLEARLERMGNRLGGDELARARTALQGGDFSVAQEIFARIDADRELDIQEAADAAFGLGKIAEAEIRWIDAAAHYAKAARLNPGFETLLSAERLAQRSGDFTTALRLGAELVAVARELKEAEKLGTALNNQALTLKLAGQYSDAEPLYRQALEITRETLGEGHPDYAIDLNNLAGLLFYTARLEEAEPLLRQALKIERETLGKGHPIYATHLNNLAGLLQVTGRFEEAEPLYRQALSIYETALGPDHPNTITARNNLEGLLNDRANT